MAKKKQRPQNKHLIPGANKNGRPKGSVNRTTIIFNAIKSMHEKSYENYDSEVCDINDYLPEGNVHWDLEVLKLLINSARNGHMGAITAFMNYAYGKPGIFGISNQEEVYCSSCHELITE